MIKGFCLFVKMQVLKLKTRVMMYYQKCVDKATDREWSTARTPNLNAFQYQDNFFVQWLKNK